MIAAVACRPAHGMTFDASPMPRTEQERIRLLCAVKHAVDHYEVAYASAALDGYTRGLYVSGEISDAMLTVFNSQHSAVLGSAIDRLERELQQEMDGRLVQCEL